MKTTESDTVCVQIQDICDAVHRAVTRVRMAYDIPIWESVVTKFEQEYGVNIITVNDGIATHIVFDTKEDYTAFMLRWA